MIGKHYSKSITRLSILACFLSNISQLPVLVTNGRTQMVCFPIWILISCILLIKSKCRLSRNVMSFVGLAVVFLIGICTNLLFSDNDYLSSSLLYSFFISLFIFFVGAFSSPYFDDALFNKITIAYIISTFLVSLSVFFTYFGFSYNLNTRVYAYASKNSFAQIIYVALVLLLCTYYPQRKIMKLLKWGIMVFELLLIVLLRSRATLLSLIVAVFLITISRNTSKRIKYIICSACVVLFILLVSNDSFYNMVINNIIFAGREASSLDNLSSGRLTIIASFPELIDGHWIVGIGSQYFECFPLSAILQFGVFPGITLIIISLFPVFVGGLNSKRNKYYYYLFLISLGFAVDGLFEGLTPFGPGIKCYYLWYLFGILICKNEGLYGKRNKT